jgi:hypothetical protein
VLSENRGGRYGEFAEPDSGSNDEDRDQPRVPRPNLFFWTSGFRKLKARLVRLGYEIQD